MLRKNTGPSMRPQPKSQSAKTQVRQPTAKPMGYKKGGMVAKKKGC